MIWVSRFLLFLRPAWGSTFERDQNKITRCNSLRSRDFCFFKFCSNPIRAQFSLCFLTPIGEITLLVPLHQFTCHFGESCNHARTHRVVMFPHLKRFLCVCVCVAKSCCFFLASVVDVTPRFQKIYIFSLWLFGWRGRKNRKMNRWFPPWVSSSGRSPCFRRWLAITQCCPLHGLWGLNHGRHDDYRRLSPHSFRLWPNHYLFFFLSFGANRLVLLYQSLIPVTILKPLGALLSFL
jgi:hypothetical protein